MRLTEEEFDSLCASRNLHAVVQGGRPSKRSAAPATALTALSEKKKRPPKYRNRKVYLYESGITSNEKDDRLGRITDVFDSEREYRRCLELQMLEKMGRICGLKRQVPLVIQDEFEYRGNRVNPIVYLADFCYIENGENVVEDVKGLDRDTGRHITTEGFNIKWKLLKGRYPDRLFRIY